ncbi:MAG TPA: hypothetical protein VFG44_11835 [Burkholderiales bacterium]|nr:hypothetical protein [Burkholderiales bacterium]
MNEEETRLDRAEEPGFTRREPTIGEPRAPAQERAPPRNPSRKISYDSDRRLLHSYEVNLADDEIKLDEVEVLDSNGLNYLVLTDRRLIIRGRDHQTIYPLRAITRLAVVKYIRWWLVLLGTAVSALGALGALMPVFVFQFPHPYLVYLWGGLFLAGILAMTVALLRPVFYVEIKSLGGDMRLRLTRDYEALVGFLRSLGQRIG